MTEVLDIENSEDPRDVIHRAVHRLTEGGLVAFPTETVYVVTAHALRPAAVKQLLETIGEDVPPTLLLKSYEEAMDYVPHWSPVGDRFARRGWPGPVTLVLDRSSENSLLAELPDPTGEAITSQGTVAMRVPAHQIVQETLKLMPAPLLAASEHERDYTSNAVGERLGEAVSLIVDHGACRYGSPSTVVRVTEDGWTILRPGIVTETMLRRMASQLYLFVCTGNTCRSPMAEALFRKLMSEKLQCEEEQLVDRGIIVASAGMATAGGAPASAEAVQLLGRRGIDLRGHESQPLTSRLLDQADHIYTMTRSHREAILADRPDLAGHVHLLTPDERDVSDPIGGGMEDYQQCEREIEEALRTIVKDAFAN